MDESHRKTLDFTGERMIPGGSAVSTFWEHIYRYRFAIPFSYNKRVLDIACGEGYGAAALQVVSTNVVGVDISEEVCIHATAKYGFKTILGSAEAIPLPSQSVDVIISFETIEHLTAPAKFLDECVRVLAPGGSLIISTPNKETYSSPEQANPYHCSELTEDDFIALLSSRFGTYEIHGQNPFFVPTLRMLLYTTVNFPWLCIRGFSRLRKLMQMVFCPHILSVSHKYNQFPERAILDEFSPLSSSFNPYIVRKRRMHTQYVFFVAVARL